MNNPFKLALGLTVIAILAGVGGTILSKQPAVNATASTGGRSASSQEAHGAESHGSSVAWLPMDKGLEQASAQNKVIMVEFFATWCGYCKKMDAQVFPDARVQTQLAKHFVPVRVTESSDNMVAFKGKQVSEKVLTRQFGVTGFPTLVFMTSEGEPITKIPGFIEADTLESVLAFIGTGAYEKMDYEQYKKSNPSS